MLFSTNGTGTAGPIPANTESGPFTKLTQKWITDPNVKSKVTKPLAGSVGGNPAHVAFGHGFVMPPEGMVHGRKGGQAGFTVIKDFRSGKGNTETNHKQEKTCARDKPDVGKIMQRLLKLNNKRTSHPDAKWSEP